MFKSIQILEKSF